MKGNKIIKIVFMFALVFCASTTSANDNQTGEISVGENETTGSYYVNEDKYFRVDSKTTNKHTRTLYGGEDVYIVVIGDGDTDLDLYVYDENNNLIASDTDNIDECLVHFTPKWTGTFYIKVKNLGNVYNKYRLKILQ